MLCPDRDQFRLLAEKEGNLISVTKKLLTDLETPLSAYLKLRGKGESFLFESVEGGERLGRYSFVGSNPRALIRQWGNQVEIIEDGKVIDRVEVAPTHAGQGSSGSENRVISDGLVALENYMKRYRPVDSELNSRFSGGAVGFLGYEFIHDVEPVVPRSTNDDLGIPTMYFFIAEDLVIFDRAAQTMTLLANACLDEFDSADAAYEDAERRIEALETQLRTSVDVPPVALGGEVPELEITSNMPKDVFLQNVRKAKEYIQAGDIIQVVGSQRFSCPLNASPVDVYRAARTINPSPYLFLLELDGFSLVGASPEIHVRLENQKVEIRPIAGTRPRGATEEEDVKYEKDLLADPKERAEHVMLVDLARNDIGRVCDYGTVQVKDLMVIERYSHVMHIVSQVEGKLSSSSSPYELMRATFPAGTLSGAPKIRAMQIIAEMEENTRGSYGGCVGYFSFNGNLDCCITIRTALLKNGFAYIQAGGGWVHAPDPEKEYQETVNKSKAMVKAVALAESFSVRD